MTRSKTVAASQKGAQSPEKRIAILDSPAGWDFCSVAQGRDPQDSLRFALYL